MAKTTIGIPGDVLMFVYAEQGGSAGRTIEWAVELLCQDWDTPHLRILAGLNAHNPREVRDRAKLAFGQLGLPQQMKKEAFIANYASCVVQEFLATPSFIPNALTALRELYFAEDHHPDLWGFYNLYWAYTDRHGHPGFYWEGANADNIEQIILEYGQKWLSQHPPILLMTPG